MSSPLTHIRIILVEPAGPLNVGSIARIMKNMGLQQLVLVNPQCDRLSSEARQMAVHAADVLEAAQQVDTLPTALSGCTRAIATTGNRDITLPLPLEPPRQALPWLLPPIVPSPSPASNATAPSPTALIFGREDSGLTRTELNYAHRLVYIPSDPLYTSLNLAQAVAICCYELHQAAIAPHSPPLSSPLPTPLSTLPPSHPPTLPASLDQLERYYQQLEALLLSIGFLYPHTAASRMSKLRRIFHRASLSEPEVTLLLGILQQMKWALQQQKPRDSEEVH